MNKDISIVYIAAGISKRFGGKIKQFARVGHNGETLIEVSINQALKAGFNKIVFVVGNLTEKPFMEKFGDNYRGIPIKYALQKFDPKKRDRPWGTCDAVCAVRDVINEPFVVCNGDDLYGEDAFKILYNHLLENYESNEEATVGFILRNVVPEDTKGVNRGIFVTDNGYVKEINEKLGITRDDFKSGRADADSLVSMGIFALHPKTLKELDIELGKYKEEYGEDRMRECFLTDELTDLISSGKISMNLYRTSGKWIGISNPEDEEVVRKELALGL